MKLNFCLTNRVQLFILVCFLVLGILCLHCWNSKMFCFHAFNIHLKSTPQGFSANKGSYDNHFPLIVSTHNHTYIKDCKLKAS